MKMNTRKIKNNGHSLAELDPISTSPCHDVTSRYACAHRVRVLFVLYFALGLYVYMNE